MVHDVRRTGTVFFPVAGQGYASGTPAGAAGSRLNPAAGARNWRFSPISRIGAAARPACPGNEKGGAAGPALPYMSRSRALLLSLHFCFCSPAGDRPAKAIDRTNSEAAILIVSLKSTPVNACGFLCSSLCSN